MFVILLVTVALFAPAYSYSTGAPKDICINNLTPMHHTDPQKTPAPYSFSIDKAYVKGGEDVKITLGGDNFLGFAVQVRDKSSKPVGTFKIVEGKKSQTLTCSAPNDTLTHTKIPSKNPIKKVEFIWTAPHNFKGKVVIVGTVAKNGGTFWVGKVLKDIQVQ